MDQTELLLTARDVDGTLHGGATGQFAYGWLCLAMLWVDERSRGQGLGSALLREAERIRYFLRRTIDGQAS